MSDPQTSPPPLEPPPRPVVTIDYDVDVAAAQAWAPLVKWLGVVAVGVSSAALATFLFEIPPLLGMRQVLPFRIGPSTYVLARLVPMALLLVGGIGCLTGRRFARPMLIGYAWAAVGVQALYFVLASTRGLTFPPGSPAAYWVWSVLQSLQSVGLPLLVIGILRQPQVKRLFGPK